MSNCAMATVRKRRIWAIANQDVVEPMIRSGMSLTPTFGLGGAAPASMGGRLCRYAEWARNDDETHRLGCRLRCVRIRHCIQDVLDHERYLTSPSSSGKSRRFAA